MLMYAQMNTLRQRRDDAEIGKRLDLNNVQIEDSGLLLDAAPEADGQHHVQICTM